MIVNSKEWWENEFENWWENGIDGKKQTYYFMQLLLKHLNVKLTGSIMDWGCALGQGLEVISKQYPNAELLGYDFSETAIKRARKLYPNFKFTYDKPFVVDNIICSNVLEHFEYPLTHLKKIVNYANKYIVILTPYNQTPTCDVHPVTITLQTFPVKFEGFTRILSKIIKSENPKMCSIKQIMFVYEKDDEL